MCAGFMVSSSSRRRFLQLEEVPEGALLLTWPAETACRGEIHSDSIFSSGLVDLLASMAAFNFPVNCL